MKYHWIYWMGWITLSQNKKQITKTEIYRKEKILAISKYSRFYAVNLYCCKYAINKSLISLQKEGLGVNPGYQA